MSRLNQPQVDLLSELLSAEMDCVLSVLEHEEYADNAERDELKERFALTKSIMVDVLIA